ncbi:TRAP transporter small permease [Halomonas garicola]|uniref:TRAP transporter small permease n=1 Tax=Halomonas garicola TaxID=1690008 RepID=UPI0028974A5A|nr:TRAP transporter small permease [Halomonas garicola]
MKKKLLYLIDNIEGYLCQFLLVGFVVLLFVQIVMRNVFSYSIPWGDELATYAFVWFAYLGAAYGTKLSAHNRITFQFKMFPQWVATFCELLTDIIWIGFNIFFIYLSYDFVFNRMNLFWTSQTMGVPMKYFYFILPIAFIAMTIRVVQKNYLKFFKKKNAPVAEEKEFDSIDKTEREEPRLKENGGE